jgi:hypothetical protein
MEFIDTAYCIKDEDDMKYKHNWGLKILFWSICGNEDIAKHE